MSINRKQFERYLTQTEEKQLFDYIAQFSDVLARRDHAWMGLLRQTGMRIKPMSLFTVDDANKALHTKHFIIRPETNKNGKPHKILATKKSLAYLKTLLLARIEMGYTSDDEAPLIMGRNHQGLSVRSFQDRMRHWCIKAQLDCEASPHWFRHTLAKRIISTSKSNNPLAIVQVALGHSSITSSGVYTMPDKEELALSMEAAS